MVQSVEASLLEGRFALERLVGSGGMGDVYRATDRRSGRPVALKFLRSVDPARADRFRREASVLLELEHPAVVRYVAHGIAEDGRPYLAMEWLEGETLADRLNRGPLSPPEALALATRVAAGLGAAHGAGIVHRDVKPSNLLLVGGQLNQAKLLDFGIARRLWQTHELQTLTQTGMVLGTPAYMSPEQARGETKLRPSTDVFSLGAVLYECLTGEAPFAGENPLAIVASICMEEPARPRSLRPEIPAGFEQLILRLLAKDESARAKDAIEVGRELAGLDLSQARASDAAPALALRERRVSTIVVIAGLELSGEASDETQIGTVERPTAQRHAVVASLLEAYGGRLERLLGGVLVIRFSEAIAPTDLAARAARFALAARSAQPEARVAMCTGKVTLHEPPSVAQLVDDVLPLLAEAASEPAGVMIDPGTAELLAARFVLHDSPRGALLAAERTTGEAPRTLLGRPSTFVGRKRELDSLVALFEECREESSPRVALVTAPSGTGKSRVCYELLQALHRRFDGVEVLQGCGDAVHAGAPFSLLGSVLRSTARIGRDDDAPARRDKLRDRIEREAGAPPKATVFLGEMAGIYFSDRADPELRSARQDPRLMGDQIRAAWVEWLRADLSAKPVVLVLEDLHWGDLPSVQLVDFALRALADRPLFVLALARPEVAERFPRLWEGRRMEHLLLQPLTKKASAALIEGVLGGKLDEGLVERLVQKAEGNAFFLEELVRAVDAGRADALPDGVMAVIQARLDLLGTEAARTLRTASIFGEAFSAEGVAALMNEAPSVVAENLDFLDSREVLTASRARREYGFRHALVRETCYAALTANDRSLGHRLAGEWLESRGETDASSLAEHFDQGGEPGRAAGFYARAAVQALQGDDLETAKLRAARGVACGATGETLARLLTVQAHAAYVLGDLPEVERLAVESVRNAPPGSTTWYDALRELTGPILEQGRSLLDWVRLAESTSPAEDARGARTACLAWMAGGLVDLDADLAGSLLDRCPGEAELASLEPLARMRFHLARALHRSAVGSVSDAISDFHRAVALSEECGDYVGELTLQSELSGYAAENGLAADAVRLGQEALSEASRRGAEYLVAACHMGLAQGHYRLGEHALAAKHATEAIELTERLQSPRMTAVARFYAARASFAVGAFEEAERLARLAAGALESVPGGWRAPVQAILARSLLELDAPEEAERYARSALDACRRATTASILDPFVKASAAEVLWATGDRDGSRAVIAAARDQVMSRAERIHDAEHRRKFLALDENARVLRLAGEGAVGTR